jgi:hypothetical protein
MPKLGIFLCKDIFYWFNDCKVEIKFEWQTGTVKKGLKYFIQDIYQYGGLNAKVQDFIMYEYFLIIYVSIGFLEFYTEQCCENSRMVKLNM